MPTTNAAPLQRLPIAPEAWDLKGRSRALYEDLTVRPELRATMDRLGLKEHRNGWLRTEGRRGAAILAGEIIELVAAGATHAEVEQLLAWVRDIAQDALALRDGTDAPSLLSAELAEAEADVAEDVSQLSLVKRLAEARALTRAELEARLLQVRRQTAAGSTLVRALEGEIRKQDLGLYRRSA